MQKYLESENIKNVPSKYKKIVQNYQRITSATEFYVDVLHNLDMKRIVDEMAVLVSDYPVDGGYFHAFPYTGLIYIHDAMTPKEMLKYIKSERLGNKSLYAALRPSKNKLLRFNIGTMSILHGFEGQNADEFIQHYVGWILDTERKEIWQMDSIGKNIGGLDIDFTGLTKFLRVMYPKYTIQKYEICSGCGLYEPLEDVKLYKQNIFCHTWLLKQIFEFIVMFTQDKMEPSEYFQYVSNSCQSEENNLIEIKKFAMFAFDEFIATNGEILPKDFGYIITNKGIMKKIDNDYAFQ